MLDLQWYPLNIISSPSNKEWPNYCRVSTEKFIHPTINRLEIMNNPFKLWYG